MVVGKINADWIRLQNNPDNWLEIPDFNVCPIDVEFRGFSRPIVGPTDKDTAFHAAVRELVSEVRGHAHKRFKSVADLLRIDDEGAQRFEIELVSKCSSISPPSGDELFVYRYDCIFAYLDAAIEDYARKKNGAIESLAFAALEVAKMMTNAAIDPQELKKSVHSEFSKKGGDKKWANSPKKSEKDQVKELWTDWQDEPFSPNGEIKYKSKTKFAKDMLEKFSNLESQAVIERWDRKWREERDSTTPAK